MNEVTPTHLLDTAVCAADAAGRHALSNKDRRSEVSETFHHDVKLVLDLECQKVAEEVIASEFPEHGILGEEEDRPSSVSPYEWIIDPIDGTMNYFHGLPYWCCSIAVRHQGRMLAGCVYAPELNTYYTAHADGPAKCNGAEIQPCDTPRLDDAMILSGLSKYMKSADEVHFDLFCRLALRTQKMRINGSAALDLCQVAAGGAEGYFETNIFLWDYAAAGLIVERAGGVILLYPEPEEEHRTTVLCANRHLIEELRALYTSCLRTG